MNNHKYKLLNRDLIDSGWLASFNGAVVVVDDCREIVVDGLTLYLAADQPSLPVGQKE